MLRSAGRAALLDWGAIPYGEKLSLFKGVRDRIMKMTTKDIPENHPIRVALRQTYHIAKGEYEQGRSESDAAFKLHVALADVLPNLPEARFQTFKTMTRMMIDGCYGAWKQGLNPTIEECADWVIHQKLVMDEMIADLNRFTEEEEQRDIERPPNS